MNGPATATAIAATFGIAATCAQYSGVVSVDFRAAARVARHYPIVIFVVVRVGVGVARTRDIGGKLLAKPRRPRGIQAAVRTPEIVMINLVVICVLYGIPTDHHRRTVPNCADVLRCGGPGVDELCWIASVDFRAAARVARHYPIVIFVVVRVGVGVARTRDIGGKLLAKARRPRGIQAAVRTPEIVMIDLVVIRPRDRVPTQHGRRTVADIADVLRRGRPGVDERGWIVAVDFRTAAAVTRHDPVIVFVVVGAGVGVARAR